MRPILLQGHERALTQIKYTRDGDIIFSTAKDQIICAWFSANGERLGTYSGHQGALWSVDVDLSTTLLASGAADNTIKLWEVRTGKCLKTWEFPTAVKRVEFSEDGKKLLGVTEKRMGHLATIVVFDIIVDVAAEQPDEPFLTITCEDAKATVAGWSFLSKYIITGHEDGSVSQYDGEVSAILQTLLCKSCSDNKTDRGAHLLGANPHWLDHGFAMELRSHLLHHCLQRQDCQDHLGSRFISYENLSRRHTAQHCRHYAKEGLRHPWGWPSSHGRHHNFFPSR